MVILPKEQPCLNQRFLRRRAKTKRATRWLPFPVFFCFQLAFADGAERTASCACAAVDAGTGINAAGVPLFANGLNRAVGFAQTTVGAFAFVDLVSQNTHLLPIWNGLQILHATYFTFVLLSSFYRKNCLQSRKQQTAVPGNRPGGMGKVCFLQGE